MSLHKNASQRRPGGINVHVYRARITHESRLHRIAGAVDKLDLFDGIWVIGVRDGDLPESEQINARRLRIRLNSSCSRFKAINTLYWSFLVFCRLWRVPVTCINCHSLPLLPLCVLLKVIKRAKLIYDAHELETETYYCRGLRKVLSKWVERVLIRFADEVCVVTQSIADWYARTYRLQRVWLVRNVSSAKRNANSSSRPLRERHRVPPDAMLFLYHGLVADERGCDTLLRAFAGASDRCHLVVMGNGPAVAQVKQYAQAHANIHYQPLVPSKEVVSMAASADVGLFLLPPNSCLSYEYSLGNKFFEYLSAGLAVVVSDNPEMAAIVRKYDCGWVHGGDQNDLAKFIEMLSPSDVQLKRANSPRAMQDYTWDREEEALRNMYAALFGKGLDSEPRRQRAAA